MSQPEMGFNMQKMSGASQKKEATKEMSKKKKRCQVHRKNEATTRNGPQHSVPASGVLRTPHADT